MTKPLNKHIGKAAPADAISTAVARLACGSVKPSINDDRDVGKETAIGLKSLDNDILISAIDGGSLQLAIANGYQSPVTKTGKGTVDVEVSRNVTRRDSQTVSKALAYAIVAIGRLPESQRENSDRDDMMDILLAWHGVEAAHSDLMNAIGHTDPNWGTYTRDTIDAARNEAWIEAHELIVASLHEAQEGFARSDQAAAD